MAKTDPEPLSEDATHGNIGQMIYDRVEALMKDGTMSRTAAFDVIATEQGRKSGTVAANYYRIAKMRDGGSTPRRSRRSGGGDRGTDLTKYIDRVEKALQDLREAVAENDREKAALIETAEFGKKMRELVASSS